MDRRTEATSSGPGLLHAGAGTGLFLIQLSAIIPGLLPCVALLGVLTAAVALPVAALGLIAAVLAAPPYLVWRLATRARRRRRTEAGERAAASVAPHDSDGDMETTAAAAAPGLT
jgi:hypothetical protein